MKARLELLVSEMVRGFIRFEDASAEFEKHFIRAVLADCKGNLSETAIVLGLHRNTLRKRIEKYWPEGVDAHLGKPKRKRPVRPVRRITREDDRSLPAPEYG